jgi:thiol:disulfide interchange protein
MSRPNSAGINGFPKFGRNNLRILRALSFALLFGHLAAPVFCGDRIVWMDNLDQGFAAAKKENKPLMIDFMAGWCEPCKEMEETTFRKPAVILKAKFFIPVRIDIDKQPQVAAKYKALARAYGGIGVPNMLFMTGEGKQIKHIVGFSTANELLAIMNSVLKSLK